MARKKKGNNKANSRAQRPEDPPIDQQQSLSSHYGSPQASDSGNDDPSTAQQRIGWADKGKGRAEQSSFQVPESASDDLLLYRPNYPDNSLSDQRRGSSLVQYASRQSLRNGPSGVFFEGSSNTEINGGKFNHTHDNQTNVEVHHHVHYDIQQHPLPFPAASPSEIPNHNIASHAAQDVHRGQVPSMAPSGSGPSTSTTIYSSVSSNVIYERHLELRERGFPLWIPEPNRSLPMCYRRKGVDIGDVGIITSSGAFSFLFNICVPHNDPINPPTLPEGFAPIYPPLDPLDICKHKEFKPISYLPSIAIEKIANDPPPFRGLSFETSSVVQKEGAILTLPDGAEARDLENIGRFRDYLAENVENWYRYVNGPRGREAKNGEIRLVTGCHMATSWGMAIVTNLTQHKTHYLKYRFIGDSEPTVAPMSLYEWDCTGSIESKVGPDLAEIEGLKRNDDSDVAVDGKYWNQSLFIRSMSCMLGDDVFAAITQELESAQKAQYNRSYPGNSRHNFANTGAQTGNTGQQSGRSSSEVSASATDNPNVAREQLIMSSSPSAPSHPADLLNRLLLEKVPRSRMVITQDKDWYSVINEDDEIMPNPSELAERVLATHRIREENGVVFLENLEANKEQQLLFRPSIKAVLTVTESETTGTTHDDSDGESSQSSMTTITDDEESKSQHAGTSTAIDSPADIYYRRLRMKGRGRPLWIPAPDRNSPMAYRRQGVSIGDVGVITPSGSFAFLFNICLPHGHPVNPETLPDHFVPISPPIDPLDIHKYLEFGPGSYLSSKGIEKRHGDPLFRGLSFETHATEGAVLVLPDGAVSHTLENLTRFRSYASVNAIDWYRYANGPCGLEVMNGDIRLVVGCDKATSWGIAAVTNMTQHKTHTLKFRYIGSQTMASSIPQYEWECTGLVEAKFGPDLQEIEDLKINDDTDVAVDGKYPNQCLFMRTLNISLENDVYAAIRRELEAENPRSA